MHYHANTNPKTWPLKKCTKCNTVTSYQNFRPGMSSWAHATV